MNEALNQLGRELFGSFGQLSVELTALALFVLLVSRVLPIKSPALRHFLWLVVLLKPIVAVTINSPWTVFTPLVPLLEPGWSALGHSLSSLHVENPNATVALPPSTMDGSSAQLTLAGWVAALWILGAALLLGRILIGYGIVWRLRRQACVQRRGPLFDALWQARLALGLDATAQVATSRSIRSPIVLSILRPLIVVPVDLVHKLRADELELVFMHELAHVRRYDNFTLLLERLITTVLFFHPAVWLCGHMLRREAEQACDDLVVCSTGRSEEYARGLTSVAELAQLRSPLIRRISIMNVFSATESDLALRIRRTLGGAARRMGTRSRILAAVLLCAMAAITLPFSGIAQTEDGVDWDAVRTTAPENWSQELKDQIAAAGYDVEAIAERVRLGQAAATRDGAASDSDRGTRDGTAADLDAIGRRIRAAVESGKLTPEEGREKMEAARQAATRDKASLDFDGLARRIQAAVENGELTPEEGREQMEAVRQAAGEANADKLRADRIWKAAMATDPDAWSDRLKAAILELKPDSTIEEIAEAIRQRQQMADTKQDEENDKLREFQRAVIARAMEVDPDAWSDGLKAAILELKPDSTIEEIAEAIRQRQQMAEAKQGEESDKLREFQRGVIARAMEVDPDAWNDRLKAAIVQAGWDLDEFTEGIRQRQQMVEAKRGEEDDKLREFQRVVIARAMDVDPDEWSDRLKAAIVQAGWDLDEFTEGIRQRQAGGRESIDLPLSEVDQTTAVEQRSWGQIKEEVNESK